ncbi:hypothetical protein BGX27_006906 [Mortierella sp. AM989]|nr:hypothetical protein BGX27_006906 [Mortierella sp. AM989]
MRLKVDSNAMYPALWNLPIELLAEIAQYVVLADDLSDYLHLGQTCRQLYAMLWFDTAEMWRRVYRTLYDPAGFESFNSTLQIEGGSNSSDNYLYKSALKERLLALQELGDIGIELEADIVSWKSLPGYGTHIGLEPNTMQRTDAVANGQVAKVSTNTQIAHALCVLATIGIEHVGKNLYWVQMVATPKLWAYATYLWFNRQQLQQPAPAMKEQLFFKTETISTLYIVLSRVAIIDPSILGALYRNEYESFRYIRGALLRHETETIHSMLKLQSNSASSQLYFPWSMIHVFYMVLFCGPSILAKEVLISPPRKISPQTTFDGHELSAILERAVPSWFNLGNSVDSITPIPMTNFPQTSSLMQQQKYKTGKGSCALMAGEWTGYYAYSLFTSHNPSGTESDGDGDDDDDLTIGEVERLSPDLEYAARGLRVDKKMTIYLVDWITESLRNDEEGLNKKSSSASSCQEKENKPLYLNSGKDAEVVKIIDEFFRRQSSSEETIQELKEQDQDVDDLSNRAHWNHQRVFSGRGRDAIGEFGIRGFVSERSGLVRLVKSYFNPDYQMLVKDMVYFEFGDLPHQLEYDLLQEKSVVWYYRGHMGPEGILGLWFDDDVSGPFWMYRVV